MKSFSAALQKHRIEAGKWGSSNRRCEKIYDALNIACLKPFTLSILLVLDLTQAVTGHPWMPPIDYVPLWKDPIRNLSIVMLPALTIGYRYAAVSMRMTRSDHERTSRQ